MFTYICSSLSPELQRKACIDCSSLVVHCCHGVICARVSFSLQHIVFFSSV